MPPSQSYRLRKFVRRNRVLFTSLSAVAVALVLGLAVSTWGLVRARSAERLAATEAVEARRQADIASAVNDFLNDDLLAAVSPSARQGQGIDVKMREVLDVAAGSIAEESQPGGRFADKPLVEAAIRHTLGKTYERLGEYELALPHVEREVALRMEVQGDRTERANWALHDLGFLRYRLGDYTKAEELILRALRFEEFAAPGEVGGIWEWKTSLAIIYEDRARYDDAERIFLDLLAAQKEALGPGHVAIQRTLGGLANLYQQTDRFDKCEAINRELLAIRRASDGDRAPGTLRVLNNLANVMANQGKLIEARDYMKEVYDLKVEILGPEHLHTLNSLNNLGEVNEMLGDWASAERWHQQAFDLRSRVLGEDHPRALGSANRLAFVKARLGKYAEAEPIIGRSVERHRAVRGDDHPETQYAEMVQGMVLTGLQRPAEAETIFRRLLTTIPADDDTRHSVRANLAVALAAQDQRPEATELWHEAVPRLWPDEAETDLLARQAIETLTRWDAEDPAGGYGQVAVDLQAFLEEK